MWFFLWIVFLIGVNDSLNVISLLLAIHMVENSKTLVIDYSGKPDPPIPVSV